MDKDDEKSDKGLQQTVKEYGVGLPMPDGTILEVGHLDHATVQFMFYVVSVLDKLEKNLV